jgi:CheY-like chemotaxis protein/HPt (histidine-containing phosphotransfer) domain-containing protein
MPDTDRLAAMARLAPLCLAYGEALPGKLAELRALADRIRAPTNAVATPAMEGLRAGAHRLAGSAPTFGFTALGRRAKRLETIVSDMLDRGVCPDDAALAEIHDAVAAMAAAIGQPSRVAPARYVALIATTAEPADSMAAILEAADIEVLPIRGSVDIADAVISQRLHAVLIQAEPDMTAALALLARLTTFRRVEAPLVFFAAIGEFPARLAAMRAGGAGFLAVHDTMVDLPAQLARVIAPDPFRPYRVLSLGGDPPALDTAIFAVRALAAPARMQEEISDFRPELLLLGGDPDGVDPVDLARLVWQDPVHRDVDIFFLAADPRMRRAFLSAGVTDRYLIDHGGDPGEIRARIVPWLHARRAGHWPGNAVDLGPHLARIARYRAAEGPATVLTLIRPLPPARAVAPPKPAPKILVVDDDRYLVAVLANALAAEGAEVLQAYNGAQGFDIAWRELPRAIVTDVEMPGGTGDRMILQLRRNPRTAAIPVVVMTHRRWEDGKDHALERDLRGRLGAASYIQKPIKVETLLQELARL